MGSVGGKDNVVLQVRNERRASGLASVLAIGTVVPPTVHEQATFADYYFKMTNSEHMVDLKEKFACICEKSAIRKRHVYMSEEVLQENPCLTSYSDPSLNVRQNHMDVFVPQMGAEASLKAIQEWGRPLSDITHLVFCNSGGCKMPGADYDLVNLLGLPLSTKRYMVYQIGCNSGGVVLRYAKDIAENNRGARVLVVCSETTLCAIRGPNEDQVDIVVGQALFGDGAGALIVGADPQPSVEKVLFEIVSASQNIIPESDDALVAKLREAGLVMSLKPEIPKHIAGIVGKLVGEALGPVGITELNDVFWVVHPGGRAIVDGLEAALGLKKEKLEATREVLQEYGNLSSASVTFVMEVMRKRSEMKNLATAGEGLEWGVLLTFGPGLTGETILLHCPIP